jgi:hypothetical protein
MTSHVEQYRRVKRYFERFKQINEGKAHVTDSLENLDDVFSFFIHCYHLKDWIKNDPKSGIDHSKVEKFVHSNESLKICGDLTNGVKHLTIDQPKVGQGAVVKGSHLQLTIGEEIKLQVKYDIEANGKLHDAFTLAKEAMKLWEEFLTINAKGFKS